MHQRLSIIILSLTLFLTSNNQAQEPQSFHKIEWLNHRHLPKQPATKQNLENEIIPLQLKNIFSPSVVVFGYLPDWEYQHAPQYLQYDLLSHIAAFDFHVSNNGNVSYPSYWPWTDVINEAHTNGVKVVMTAVNFEGDEIHTILTDPDVKINFFNNCKNIIETFQLDGVNVDFESLNVDDRGIVLNNFMMDLTNFIKSEFPLAEVSFAGPAVNWGGWELEGLALSCDYIFIMGYAFYGSWSSTSGPCAPLSGGSYNITNTVNVQYGAVTSDNPERLILGVPYYGNRWQTENQYARSNALEHLGSPRYYTAITESETHGLLWDSQSQTPWYRYQQSNNWYQVWFDNDASLELKYDLADSKNYLGVGMWALGYDGAEPELWDLLRRRYGPSNTPNLLSQKPRKFELKQNYPNPFNSKTVINYQLAVASEVELSIYNLLGQKICTLVSDEQLAGAHPVIWDASAQASGIYILHLIASTGEQNFIQTKKTILRK